MTGFQYNAAVPDYDGGAPNFITMSMSIACGSRYHHFVTESPSSPLCF